MAAIWVPSRLTDLTGNLVVTSPSSSTKAVVVKGASGQSAALQEWQDNGGGIISQLDASGNFITYGPALYVRDNSGSVYFGASNDARLYRLGAGYLGTTGSFSITGSSAAAGVAFFTQPSNASHIGVIVKGAPSQTASLQEWQDSTGTVLHKLSPDGNTYWGGADLGGTYNYFAGGSRNLAVFQWQAAIDSYTIVSAIAGNAVTGSLYGFLASGSVTDRFSNRIQNASGDAVFDASALGNGNAFSAYGKNGGQSWSAGYHQADGNSYKISAYGNPVAYNALKITPTGATTLYSLDAGAVPLTVRGYVGATANLQEWQDNSGNVLGSFSPTRFAIATSGGSTLFEVDTNSAKYGWGISGYTTNTLRLGVGVTAIYTDNSGQVSIGGAVYAPTAQLDVRSSGSTIKGLVVRGAPSQSANLQEWQNSTGSTRAVVNSLGYVGIGTDTPMSSLHINGSATLWMGEEVGSGKVYSQQTIDTAANTLTIQVTKQGISYGEIRLNPSGGTVFIGDTTTISPAVSGNTGLVVKGVVGQTASLQEWQNSVGTTLSSVDKSGYICVPTGSGAPGTNPTSGGGLYYDTAGGKLYAWDGSAWKSVTLS